jgi:hypothetical protein
LKIGQSIFVLIHGLQDLLDSIAGQYDEVGKQKGPEHINLYHFEVGANESHDESKSGSFPDFHLTQRSNQRFVGGVLQVESAFLLVGYVVSGNMVCEGVHTFSFVVIAFRVVGDSAGSKVANE